MIELGVNIDHVATVRQARRTYEPDPVWAAVEAHLGGADGITVHLREDRRHIQDDDLLELSQSVTTVLNVELATASDITELVCRLRPYQATVVPENTTARPAVAAARRTAVSSSAPPSRSSRQRMVTMSA